MFRYLCEVARPYGVNPVDLWNGAELWQVFEMAQVIPEARRQELRELVYVAHAEPKEYLGTLKAVKRTRSESLATLAEYMHNPDAARDIRRDEMARKLMEQDNGG